MAEKRDGKQYTFRINFNNSDHLKVYRTLEDLNLNIHKSISSFVIKAILFYVKEHSDASITNRGKADRDNKEGYITRLEMEEMEKRITMNILKEVVQMFGNASVANQSVMMNQMMQMIQNNQQDNGSKLPKVQDKEETTDEALEEMSLLFSQSDYGEE